jgi:membrane protein DedA with SNARE-associated domain
MDFTQLASTLPWGIYVLIVITPFIQEDTAVVGAATASISSADPVACYLLLVLGISCSDLFKYWIGRASHVFGWTRRLTSRPDVLAARERVLKRLGLTLLIARFVPGTRIPLFVASGLFRAPFARVAAYVVGSAFAYAGAIFAVFHTLGAAMGEQARRTLPLVALAIVLLVMAAQFARSALARRTAVRLSRAPGKPMSGELERTTDG